MCLKDTKIMLYDLNQDILLEAMHYCGGHYGFHFIRTQETPFTNGDQCNWTVHSSSEGICALLGRLFILEQGHCLTPIQRRR